MVDCGHCWKCREGRGCIRSVTFSQDGMPTRHPKTIATNQMEARWHKDMGAYHRLRMNGLQPKQIDGCAELESRANSQLEVELGDTLRDLAAEMGEPIKKLMPRVEEGMALSKELDWKPQDSVEAVKDKYHR